MSKVGLASCSGVSLRRVVAQDGAQGGRAGERSITPSCRFSAPRIARLIATAFAAALVCAMLAGCGGGSSSQGASQGASAAAGAPPSAAASAADPAQAERYAAYRSVVNDYKARYGEHAMMQFAGDAGSVNEGKEWAVGLALAMLEDFDGDGADELFLVYRDSADAANSDEPGYDQEAYHVEVWGCEGGQATLLHEGHPPSGDGKYMPVMLYRNPQATDEARTILFEQDGGPCYYGFDGGAFGLLYGNTRSENGGTGDGAANGSRAEDFTPGNLLSEYSQTVYYFDSTLSNSNSDDRIDCARVFEITDATLATLG